MFFKRLWKWIKDTYYKISDWFKEHFTRTEIARTEMEENTVSETTQLLPHETEGQSTQSFWKNSWDKTCNFFNSLKLRFTTIRQRIYEEERQSLERLAESEQQLAESEQQLAEAREERERDRLEQEKATEELKQRLEAEKRQNDEEIQQMYRELQEIREKNAEEDREWREKQDREMQEFKKEFYEMAEKGRIAMEEQKLRNREYINNLELFAVSVGKLVKSQVRINEELTYALECTRDCFQMIRQRSAQLSNLVQHLFRENSFLRLYIYQAHMLRHRIDLYPSPQFSQRQISAIQRAITNEPKPMLEMSKEHLHE